VPLPAFIPLIFWIGQQVYMLVFNGAEGVSWAAHVGGIAAGLVLTPVFKRWGVPLFDRRIIEPRAVELDNQTRVADDRR
jgi:membrane associated rhomboid family serine protease